MGSRTKDAKVLHRIQQFFMLRHEHKIACHLNQELSLGGSRRRTGPAGGIAPSYKKNSECQCNIEGNIN